MASGRKRNGKGRGLTLLGIAAGAAIGGAVALFYTPAAGEKNRQRLSEWAGQRLDDAQQKAQGALEGVQHA